MNQVPAASTVKFRSASTAAPPTSGRVDLNLTPCTAGSRFATRVLEKTVIEGAVSAKTSSLIEQEVASQPSQVSATDTLNLVTGMLLGSPEFQLR